MSDFNLCKKESGLAGGSVFGKSFTGYIFILSQCKPARRDFFVHENVRVLSHDTKKLLSDQELEVAEGRFELSTPRV